MMFSNLNIVPIATELRTRVGDIKFGQVPLRAIISTNKFSSTFAYFRPQERMSIKYKRSFGGNFN